MDAFRLSWQHYPHPTAGLVAVHAATAGTTPAMAVALREAIDAIIGGNRPTAVLAAAAAAAAFALQTYLRDLGRVLEVMLLDRLGALHLRPRIEGELAGLPGLDHLERTDLLDRVTVLRGFGWHLSASMWTAVAAVFDVVKLGLLLVLLGVTVTPWLLPLVVFAAAPIWFDHRARQLVSRAEIDTAEPFRLQRHLFNLATGPAGGKEIRVAGAGEQIAIRQRRAWAEAMHSRYRARIRATAWKLAGWTLFTAGFGAGLALAVYRAAHGIGTVGDLVLAITVAVTLRDSVQHTLFYLNMAMSGRTVAEPYQWLQDHAATAHRPADAPAPMTLRQGITLDRVSFTYPGTQRRALDEVSCHLPAGSVVAIVGEYGSGKTTLVKLLGKFYQPDEGRILVDGAELASLDTAHWRARSSAAFQDFGRFHIRFGDAIGIGDLPHLHGGDRVTEAVRAADAEQLLHRLPHGLQTQLGRRFNGVELSEGQWQKTALARAAMRAEPLLFLLDEPTASLDAPSEHAIFQRYTTRARQLAGRTGTITVIVSHRFSTVAGADRILVLHRGRLVQQGTHEELLTATGPYADLYRIQSNAYTDATAKPPR
jgi:ATP-binding cassette subfamily B protein